MPYISQEHREMLELSQINYDYLYDFLGGIKLARQGCLTKTCLM